MCALPAAQRIDFRGECRDGLCDHPNVVTNALVQDVRVAERFSSLDIHHRRRHPTIVTRTLSGPAARSPRTAVESVLRMN